MKTYTPAEVFPPGEFLKDELEERGWSQEDLAAILGRPPRTVNEIIHAKRAITAETAQGLGEAFGVDPQYWLNLESAYRLSKAPQPDSGVAKRAELYAKAPIKELLRRRWIEKTEDANELEARLLRFCGISSLDEQPKLWPHAARKSSSYSGVTPAQWAWLCRARGLAQSIAAPPYQEARLDELVQRLRALLGAPDKVVHVANVMREFGIRLIIVEPLAKSKLDGACFWLDESSPVIALSIRFDRIDAFWFTLFHELAHVKAKDGLENSSIPLDTDLVGQGAIPSEDKSESERRADHFAANAIIARAELSRFVACAQPQISKEKIRGFAHSHGVHPGLIVGQLQHLGALHYSHSREMLEKIREHVVRSAPTDGWGSFAAGPDN